ncbi:photosystem II protein PsbQ [Leptodesmis sichuanensis]|uniref:photosystem II protein PsbQ n=1 Tax=Leptodesmis sichuanensis TaxID=2906798 RepID=UPI001F3E3C00|nr:photosystem II protein PsbQ [Leptodesmis sichuanensis]UIE36597.1 photosystem II protein PsbQ [Leptodesmis sichuanensis A121]
MLNYRSVVACILALVTAFLLNVGHAEAAKKVKQPPTYTAEQLEQIQAYAAELQTMRDRLPELAPLITRKDWTFTRNFIRGPLGELRIQMQNLSRTLLPDAQKSAQTLAKTVFDDLIAIDQAAQDNNYQVAIRKYASTIKDFDAFLALVPEAARPKPAAAAKPEPEKPRLQLFAPKEETPPPVAEPEATESAVEENLAPSEE